MTGTRVKICGVTVAADALLAARAGADLLGFNFYPPSPRYLEPDAARAIVERLRAEPGAASPLLVGVFVNESASRIAEICAQAGMDCAQLSGDEKPQMLEALPLPAFRAIRPRDVKEAFAAADRFQGRGPGEPRAPSLLLDAWHPHLYGGSGGQASLEVAQAVKRIAPRLMLAGGLRPANVGARVATLRPWGVDVASGVERAPGRKDADLVRDFIVAAKGA